MCAFGREDNQRWLLSCQQALCSTCPPGVLIQITIVLHSCKASVQESRWLLLMCPHIEQWVRSDTRHFTDLADGFMKSPASVVRQTGLVSTDSLTWLSTTGCTLLTTCGRGLLGSYNPTGTTPGRTRYPFAGLDNSCMQASRQY